MTQISVHSLIDDSKCYETVRQLRWPENVSCPHCQSNAIKRNGSKKNCTHCQRYLCNSCGKRFDDLTNTAFSGHHQPLKVWILCLYFMGLNLSNRQIGQELNVNEDDIQRMTTILRNGIIKAKEKVTLSGEVECDEVYVVAGHKGNAEAVKKKGRRPRRNRLKGARGRGTLEKEKPPVFGMIQRAGQVVISMLENVKQKTIKPFIESTIASGTQIYTDEYDIYSRLPQWGYDHKTVCHSKGEFARDEDGDGFHEVHVNTMEGFWSLLRSWLKPHRGISQEKLPLYLGFFEFVHNTRKRGKNLIQSLIRCILNPQHLKTQ